MKWVYLDTVFKCHRCATVRENLNVDTAHVTLSRGQRRYRDWLSEDGPLKFGEWLKQRQYDRQGLL